MTTTGGKNPRFWPLLVLLAAIPVGILVALPAWIPFLCTCSVPIGRGPSNMFICEGQWDEHKPYTYVAHALGEINNDFYTNSREAFLSNYEKGFRTFEVDLVLLKDGSAFCAHDGAESAYDLDKPFIDTTAEELTGRLYLGKYIPLTGSNLLDLVYEYKDACFILDTKRTTPGSTHDILKALVSEAKERHPSVLNRMIPHTFGPADLCEVAKIYPFRNYWVAVYSFEYNTNGSSSSDAERIVLYMISNGWPVSLLGIMDAPDSALRFCGSITMPFFLQCPALGLVSPACDVRVYVSVDVIGE